MENLYNTLCKIKEKISPRKSKVHASQQHDMRLIPKESLSEDNPFKENKNRKRKISFGNDDISNTEEVQDFIRNQNLSKSVQDKEKQDEKHYKEFTHCEANPKEENTSKNLSNSKDPKFQEDSVFDEDDKVSLEVLEEMNKLEESFPKLGIEYRLIDKIGEGTFSTVYKAECFGASFLKGSDIWKNPPLKKKKTLTKQNKQNNQIVALKQIYVTSSPSRIFNELNLLYILSGNSRVASLLDVLRYQDQVLAVLPYYHHTDFRDFYRDIPLKGIKKYLWELFQSLSFIHSKGVIHRDLKPTNFLYDPFKGKGVLVDFGLAEKVEEGRFLKGQNLCPCLTKDKQKLSAMARRNNLKFAYPKQDQRPPRRANRAGTRGFRAPEVLLKCTNQTQQLDIWSAGVIALSFISRKFPFFNSPDDTDALIELALVFGLEKLQKCAELHGCGFEIVLPEGADRSSGNLLKVIYTFLKHEWSNGCFPQDSVVTETLAVFDETGDSLKKPQQCDLSEGESIKKQLENYEDHKWFMQLLYGCFQMDPKKRLTASEILRLHFFQEISNPRTDDVLL